MLRKLENQDKIDDAPKMLVVSGNLLWKVGYKMAMALSSLTKLDSPGIISEHFIHLVEAVPICYATRGNLSGRHQVLHRGL